MDAAKQMPMGVGLDEQNVLGPLQNKAQYDIVADLVQAAKDSGARVLTGGDPEAGQPGYFYPTTLVADIDNDNPLVAREQSARPRRSSSTPASTRSWRWPTGSRSASVPRSGPRIRPSSS
jgi:hypothetical protein